MKPSGILTAIAVLLSFTVNAHIKHTKTGRVNIPDNCSMCERAIEEAGSIKNVAEVDTGHGGGQHNHGETARPTLAAPQDAPGLQQVFESYFAVKDALVKSDVTEASSKGTQLEAAIKAVEMNRLSAEEHTVWMKAVRDLATNAAQISIAEDISEQRRSLSSLSAHMYELIKVSDPERPVYYQHCPMYNNGKGGNWLSRESPVKNPFYGTKMLTCGSTVDTL